MASHLSSKLRSGFRSTAPVVWPWVKKVLPWLIILLPAFLLAGLIKRHQVNIPFLDDWMFVEMDAKAAAGTLTLKDFFIVQMEHRMAFVRAVIMAFHHLWPGAYTKQMWFGWSLIFLTGVNIALLLRKTTGRPFRGTWPLLALASMALFTPVQYQIVLWAMMFQVAVPAFGLSSAMVAFLSPLPLWLRYLIGLVGAVCATLSFATGILVWVLMIPLILWAGTFARPAQRWFYLAFWVVAFAVTMGLYFHDLKNETASQFSYKQGEEETMGRNFDSFFSHPFKGVAFAVRMMGGHLARGSSIGVMDASLWLGGLSLALVAGASIYWCRRYKDTALRQQLLPWLLFGGYTVGAGALVAVGRGWATTSGDNAISARYVIHAVPLTVALPPLLWLIARDLRRRYPQSAKKIGEALTGAAFALLVIQVISWTYGWRMMGVWESSRLRGAANTLFYKTIYEAEGDIAGNRKLARQADDLGQLNPPMLRDRRLDNFSLAPEVLSPNSASFTSCKPDPSGKEPGVMVSGFACLGDRRRVADAVVFTYKDPTDGRWEIFHVTQVTGLPLYLLQTLSRDLRFVHTPGGQLGQDGLAGFSGRFELKQLPDNGTWQIMAWALDYKKQQVFPMKGFFEVDSRNGHVKSLGTDPRTVGLDKMLLHHGGKPREKEEGKPQAGG